MKQKLLLTLLLSFMIGSGYGQQVQDNTSGRLWGLCKVWGYMKYYHPKICQINWDSLVNEKVPQVINATSNADYNTILMDMVQDLGQLSPAQATVAPAGDSNLNLDTVWMNTAIFDQQLRDFLHTFASRAGRNDSIMACYATIRDLIQAHLTLTPNYTTAAGRLTVAFNIWNNFNYFSPYRNLIDQPWDSVLLEAIPEFLAASNRRDFDYASTRMYAKIDDSHGIYYGQYRYFKTNVSIGIRIERIEHQAVVTKVYPGVNGIQPGDVVLEVDGTPIDQITDSFRAYIPVSNDSRFYALAYRYVCAGSVLQPTNVTVKLRNAAQQEYTTTLTRDIDFQEWVQWEAEDTKPEWTILCNGYGYVNMNKLDPDHVNDMYEDLKNQPAIVFDVRSYLQTSIWDLAPLFMPQRVSSALFWRQTSSTPGRFNFDTDAENVDSFLNASPYPGKLYFLTNENAQSASEYFIQYMKHAPDATVVGSQTSGADGNILTVNPTASLFYVFTGLGVAYIDGYQCQRNGIRIDDPVSPTISGIRQGIDELLAHVTGCNAVSIANRHTDQMSIALYPNPAGKELTLNITEHIPDKASIRISNLIGQTQIWIHDQAIKVGQSQIHLNIASLHQGLYFLTIQTERGLYQTLKFVKQ